MLAANQLSWSSCTFAEEEEESLHAFASQNWLITCALGQEAL